MQEQYTTFLQTAKDQFDDFSGAKINRVKKDTKTINNIDKKNVDIARKQPTDPIQLSPKIKKSYKINYILNNKRMCSN